MRTRQGKRVQTTACLSYFDPKEYALLRGIVPQLIPYDEWLEKFTKGRKECLTRYDEVHVVFVTYEALVEFAASRGLVIGPKASATFAMAAVAGRVKAEVARARVH